MHRPKLLLVGGGGHCVSCIDVIEREDRFSIHGIVDKTGQAGEGSVMGYPVLGDDDVLCKLREECDFALVVVGQIGSSVVRQRITSHLKELGYQLPTIISPHAHLSPHAFVGEGTIVMHGAVVNAGAVVGSHCILNSQCLVEHGAYVGDFVHVATGAMLNGDARVGDGSFIGSGATIIQGVSLSEERFVKANSLVVSELDSRPLREEC